MSMLILSKHHEDQSCFLIASRKIDDALPVLSSRTNTRLCEMNRSLER